MVLDDRTTDVFRRGGCGTERYGSTPARCLGTHQRFLVQSQTEDPSSSIIRIHPGVFFQKPHSLFVLSARTGEQPRLRFGMWLRPRSVKKRTFYAEEQIGFWTRRKWYLLFNILPFYPAFSDDKTFRHKSGVISTRTGQNSSSTV